MFISLKSFITTNNSKRYKNFVLINLRNSLCCFYEGRIHNMSYEEMMVFARNDIKTSFLWGAPNRVVTVNRAPLYLLP